MATESLSEREMTAEHDFAERRRSLDREYAAKLAAVKDEHEQRLVETRRKFDEEIADETKRHRERLQSILATEGESADSEIKDHEGRKAELRRRMADELDMLRKQHDEEKERMRRSLDELRADTRRLEAEEREAIAAKRASLDEERRLQAEVDGRLEAKRRLLDDTNKAIAEQQDRMAKAGQVTALTETELADADKRVSALRAQLAERMAAEEKQYELTVRERELKRKDDELAWERQMDELEKQRQRKLDEHRRIAEEHEAALRREAEERARALQHADADLELDMRKRRLEHEAKEAELRRLTEQTRAEMAALEAREQAQALAEKPVVPVLKLPGDAAPAAAGTPKKTIAWSDSNPGKGGDAMLQDMGLDDDDEYEVDFEISDTDHEATWASDFGSVASEKRRRKQRNAHGRGSRSSSRAQAASAAAAAGSRPLSDSDRKLHRELKKKVRSQRLGLHRQRAALHEEKKSLRHQHRLLQEGRLDWKRDIRVVSASGDRSQLEILQRVKRSMDQQALALKADAKRVSLSQKRLGEAEEKLRALQDALQDDESDSEATLSETTDSSDSSLMGGAYSLGKIQRELTKITKTLKGTGRMYKENYGPPPQTPGYSPMSAASVSRLSSPGGYQSPLTPSSYLDYGAAGYHGAANNGHMNYQRQLARWASERDTAQQKLVQHTQWLKVFKDSMHTGSSSARRSASAKSSMRPLSARSSGSSSHEPIMLNVDGNKPFTIEITPRG